MKFLNSFVTTCMSALSARVFATGTTQPQGTQETRHTAPRAVLRRVARHFPSLHATPRNPSPSHAPNNVVGGRRSVSPPQNKALGFDNNALGSAGMDGLPPYSILSSSGSAGTTGTVQNTAQPSAGLTSRGRKRKGRVGEQCLSSKKRRTFVKAQRSYQNDLRMQSVYTKYRTDYPSIPEGGQRFEKCGLLQMLGVQQHKNSIFVLMQWDTVVQGSRFSWEEVHQAYQDFGDDVVNFLVELAPGNEVAKTALGMLEAIFEPKIFHLDQESLSSDPSLPGSKNKPKKFLELCEYRGSILVLVEWERAMRGAKFTCVEVQELYHYIGDVVVAHLRAKAIYSSLAAKALEHLGKEWSQEDS